MSDIISPAIAFFPDAYETTSSYLRGLAVANQGFLRGLVRHGQLDTLRGYMMAAGCDEAFEKLAQDVGATMPTDIIQPNRLDQLSHVGILKLGDPGLAQAARMRSFVGHRAYALTGITHTTAGAGTPMLADLVAADVQPWDAVVCTSRAVAAMVTQVLQVEEERLEKRLKAARYPRPLLPIIPLGIDSDHFAPQADWRARWHERLGIGPDDVSVLYVGRLTRHNKAHPLPMMAALGPVARSRPIHLILAGSWQDPTEEEVWRENAAALCPEVRLHVLDGLDEAVRREIWSAADIFTFLIDNIQETFGLAPVEAMAAGLPVVASDWDGLRDTVRHGTDGMLIPTLMAPPGEGLKPALYYATNAINEIMYFAAVAQRTAIDIGAATEAFEALANDPALRQRMGKSGQARARETFDWSAVIPQYQALWQEQQAIRLAEPVPEVGLGLVAPDPRHMDPTLAFAAWPSCTFEFSKRIRSVPSPVDPRTLLTITALAGPNHVEETEILQLWEELQRRGEATAEDLLSVLPAAQRDAGYRGVLRLLRTGMAAPV